MNQFIERKNEKLVLCMFVLVEFFIGISFLFPILVSDILERHLNEMFPLWIWALIFLFGASLNFCPSYLELFILGVSIPLFMFSGILLKAFVMDQSVTFTGVTTYFILSITSSILSGRILNGFNFKNFRMGRK